MEAPLPRHAGGAQARHVTFQPLCGFLQDIDLGDGTDATGLILSEVNHKAANENQAFDRADRALETYNPLIQDNNNNAVCLRQDKN